MRPLSIGMKNIYSHADSYLNLRGVRLASIVGEVEGKHGSGNTAGKSGIFDAMEFALYGKTRSGTSRMIHDGENSCEVKFIFRGDDGNAYRVKRAAKLSKKGKVSTEVSLHFAKDGQWVRKEDEKKKGSRGTQELIDKTVGMNKDIFRQSVKLQQKDIGAFAGEIPSERRKVLDHFVDTSDWKQLEEIAKEDRDSVELEMDKLDKVIEDLTERVADEDDLKELVANANKSIRSKNAEKSHKKGEIQGINDRLQKTEDIDKLKNKVDGLNAELSMSESLCTQMKENLESLVSTRKREVEACKVQLQKKDGRLKDLENLKKELSTATTAETNLTQVKKEVEVLRVTLSGHEKDLAVIRSEQGAIKEQKAKLLGIESCCPTCRSDVTDDHKDYIVDLMRKDFNRLKDRAVEIKKATTQDRQAFESKLSEESILEQKAASKPRLAVEISQILEWIEELKLEYDRIKASRAAYEAKEKELKENGTKAVARANDLRKELEKVSVDYSTAKKDIDRIHEVRNEYKAANLQFETIESELSNLQRQVGVFNAKLEASQKIRKEIDEKKEHKNELLKKRNIYANMAKMMGRKGIQAIILENAISQLEADAKIYLKRFAGDEFDIHFETSRENVSNLGSTETLDIMVDKGNNVWHPYESFSGSERMKIDFAIRVALAQFAASSSFVRAEYLYIDEVAGSLDSNGRKMFMEILSELTKDFDLILVVTHFPELQDEFSDVIKVKRSGYISKIENSDEPEAEDFFEEKAEEKPKKKTKKASLSAPKAVQVSAFV